MIDCVYLILFILFILSRNSYLFILSNAFPQRLGKRPRKLR